MPARDDHLLLHGNATWMGVEVERVERAAR